MDDEVLAFQRIFDNHGEGLFILNQQYLDFVHILIHFHNKQCYSDSYCKSTSFSRFTSYGYHATVFFYHCLYIEKPQSVAFGIVDISCRNPVEFIENVRLFIRRDTNTVVCN